MNKYDIWIENWLKTNKPTGACARATLEMQEAFPELVRVRGHINSMLAQNRQHWWLQTKKGEIIDPTETQFTGIFEYIPWNEGDPEPKGKCMNCGQISYYDRDVCSEQCGIELNE